jgi:hypothetical protein
MKNYFNDYNSKITILYIYVKITHNELKFVIGK